MIFALPWLTETFRPAEKPNHLGDKLIGQGSFIHTYQHKCVHEKHLNHKKVPQWFLVKQFWSKIGNNKQQVYAQMNQLIHIYGSEISDLSVLVRWWMLYSSYSTSILTLWLPLQGCVWHLQNIYPVREKLEDDSTFYPQCTNFLLKMIHCNAQFVCWPIHSGHKPNWGCVSGFTLAEAEMG